MRLAHHKSLLMIDWFAKNSVAANLLMVTIVVTGLISLSNSVSVEVFPSYEVEAVSITTVLRGATPGSIEDTITKRIEEDIYDIEGIKEINSRSSEGVSFISAEVDDSYEKREILNEVKLRVEALNSLPANAERPVIELSTFNPGVMFVVVRGLANEKSLRYAAEQVREDLLVKPQISLVTLLGVTDHEISVEVSPKVLENYNLSLEDIGDAINQGSADISAGNLKTANGEILVRADAQALSREAFTRIPILTNNGADPVLLGEIASINDGFEDTPISSRFNGEPAILMEVLRTGQQSSLELSQIIRDYIDEENLQRSDGVVLEYWDDDSQYLASRLSTLIWSAIYGSILVFTLLALFLRPAIAFWVFIGVPISFFGAFILIPFIGGTINIISLFAFITVLGIVVDDAIVTGENIYKKMHEGLEPIEAAIVGTREIALPVTFGIFTTIVTFLPMFFLGDTRFGIFAKQIPIVVIPVLLFSLIESKFVLPSHLSRIHPRNQSGKEPGRLSQIQMSIARWLESLIQNRYKPFLYKCLNHKLLTVLPIIAFSVIIISYSIFGHLKFTFFPRIESEEITFTLAMPDTTGFDTTHQHISNITEHIVTLKEKYRDPDTGKSIIRHIYSTTGSNGSSIKPSVGRVKVEIIPPEERHIKLRAFDLTREAREMIGDIPGAEKFGVHAELGPSSGSPIAIELRGSEVNNTQVVANKLRQRLREYPQVFDIQDNYSGGKDQLNISLKPTAYAMGLDLVDVGSQVRSAVFGYEAQRVQRGRNESRVMIRLPLEHRSSIEDLSNMPIRVGQNGDTVALSSIANIVAAKSPTSLYRSNRSTVLTISADVDKETADVPAIIRDLKNMLVEEQQKSAFSYSFKGETEEQSEANSGLLFRTILALITIYALLAIPFKSYTQPFIIMSVIPFSAVGAILGHIIMFKDLSMLSIVGIAALVGVVVNDSLVLVNHINKLREKGRQVFDAVLESATSRFRPIILTSITTFAGLTPLLLDESTQSHFLKPMAISLSFGILFATIITLILVPLFYLIAYRSKYALYNACQSAFAYWQGGSTAPASVSTMQSLRNIGK